MKCTFHEPTSRLGLGLICVERKDDRVPPAALCQIAHISRYPARDTEVAMSYFDQQLSLTRPMMLVGDERLFYSFQVL